MTKSSAPSSALKSQLEVMSGAAKTVNPQSALARFVFGDLKGGEHKHNYAMSVVRSAIEQAYKGNTRDIPEAVALCTGKSVKAKAYQAGFHAIADMVAPVKYTGKLADADNASVRDVIASSTKHAACEFEIAYLATVENAKIEAAFNRKAKAKAPAAEPTPAANDETGATGAPAAAPVADGLMVDIPMAVESVIKAMQAGLLNADEIDAVAAALTLHNMTKIDATTAFNAAMLSAEPVRAMLNA